MPEKEKSLSIKQLPQILLDFLVVACWGLYDFYLALRYRKKSPYVDVHIMGRSERRFLFPKDVGGGYAGIRLIKIFVLPNTNVDEFDMTCDIINHETLHSILNNVISYKAKARLDKVQKAIYVYNYGTKKWSYRIVFNMVIKGKVICWID